LAAEVLSSQAGSKTRKRQDTMIIGAAIAGLLIISLFFEMIASSPKASEDVQAEARNTRNA
jgi:hypothetical protein